MVSHTHYNHSLYNIITENAYDPHIIYITRPHCILKSIVKTFFPFLFISVL